MKTRRISVVINADDHDNLKILAIQKGITISDMIREFIETTIHLQKKSELNTRIN